MNGPRLSVTPAGAIEDVIAGHMRDSDYRVLCALGTFTDRRGWTTPTRQSRLAARCGFGRQKVNEALTVLEWLGWVEVRRAERADKPAAYRVHLDPGDEREPGDAPDQSLAEFKKLRRGEPSAEAEDGAQDPAENGGDEGATLSPVGDTPPVAGGRQGPVAPGTTPPVVAGTTAGTIPFNEKKKQKAPGPVASPPDGGDRTDAVEPKPAAASAKPIRSKTRREGGSGKGRGKSRLRQFKSGPAERLAEREPVPEPDLPEYDHGCAEGAFLDAMLGGTGRSNRHAAPWLTPEGGFRFRIVRHPLNGDGVKGLYLVAEDQVAFRSTFTGAMIHFGFPDTALVIPAFWERAKARLRDRGAWRSEYEHVGADALTETATGQQRETRA
ncbi:MAG: hypothetical protein CMH92_14090 [Oceanicaulis sp.]|nr:hypothetical protein [Oceanicaulis sp.]